MLLARCLIVQSMAGLVADGRQLVNRAREEALSYKKNYGSVIPPHVLADRMGQFVHYYTLYGSIRPFGTAIMLAGYDADEKKASLYMVEPSGVTYVRFGNRGIAVWWGRMSIDKMVPRLCAELPRVRHRQGTAGRQDRDRKVQAVRHAVS